MKHAQPLNRRLFLTGLGAASFVPHLARAQNSDTDVVVIGAGASGIAAARRVIASGKTVQVIEAADRIGGRAFTEITTFGVPYDQGCAWLQGPDTLPHLQAAKDLGYRLENHNYARDVFFVDGRRATSTEQSQYDRAYARLENALTTNKDVSGASLTSLDEPMDAVAQSWVGPMDFGVDLANLSTADWNGYPEYDVNYLVHEGLGSLVAHLGWALPVSLNTAATHVDWSGQGVRVETTQGTLSAKAVIVTVSTGVLASGAIKFTPEMPVQKEQAIDDVPMGLLTRIGLQFDGERFGLRNSDFLTYAVPNEIPAKACYFLTFPTGHDIAVGFVGGQLGWDMAKAGQKAAVDFALTEFVNAVGSSARNHFVKGHMSEWANNPLTIGAYSAAKPGRAASRKVIAEPMGDRVFFAGEAVAGPYIALMSGAHMSGDAVGQDVVAMLGGSNGCGSCDARHQNLTKD